MQIDRNTCTNNNWCSFTWVNLDHEHFDNMEWVYVIWYFSWQKPVPVRVWQWIIKDRISEHRENNDILKYEDNWLYVTWANVSDTYKDWVEKYLWETLSPLVWERFPEWNSIAVNLPR
jgi:hypothetical protein